MAFDNKETDKSTFVRLIRLIYELEKNNYKTKKIKDVEMTEKIRKMIEEEVNKNENQKHTIN
ncbi:MAG: hypothetical protein LBT51_05685 [Fusobacteriaceae bacterium]|nr:hypothetical protein [Fusobacteriaceae bacterium]